MKVEKVLSVERGIRIYIKIERKKSKAIQTEWLVTAVKTRRYNQCVFSFSKVSMENFNEVKEKKQKW